MKQFLFCCLSVCMLLFTSCEKEQNERQSEAANLPAEQVDYHERTCNMHQHQNDLLSDPEYRRKYEKRVLKTREMLATRSSINCTTPTIVPIAVHFQSISNPDIQCLRALAQSQIDVLNADYKANNSDVGLWDAVKQNYPGVSPTDACLKFCLADKNHPPGFGLVDGDPAVTINNTTGDTAPQWANYINIFVQPNTGVLGYSPLGGQGDGDGVVIDASAFGTGQGCGSIAPQPPYNLGRTLTHELGHYLLLDHLWGNGGCASDDNIADTPTQDDSNYGCPAIGTSSCSSIDLYMSYMDYTNDACMYMFSGGQAATMHNYATTNLQGVINNASNVCSTTNNGTDADGDGIDDTNDNCPNTPNTDQTDTDGDGVGDACDTTNPVDTDGDGVTDTEDNCPNTPNADQQDTDGDGIGDACDTTDPVDTDGDGIVDADDNCPNTFNPGQSDTDGNGIGDACESVDPDPSDCDGLLFTLSITPDFYPEEISWVVINLDTDEIVHESDAYDEGQQEIEEEFCLEDGCYAIIMEDAYGDGICCDYGEGSFDLSIDGDVLYESDGNYGSYEEIILCVESGEFGNLRSKKEEKKANLKKKAPRTEKN